MNLFRLRDKRFCLNCFTATTKRGTWNAPQSYYVVDDRFFDSTQYDKDSF